MPLQIRRGTAAERNSLSSPLAIGELLYTTDTGRLYIGDGTALGGPDIQGNPDQGGKGLTMTGFTTEDAQDATASLILSGTHSHIFFFYDDTANSLSSSLNLSNYSGDISLEGSLEISANLQVGGALTIGGNLEAAGFKGSLFADDSTLLINAIDNSINLNGTVKGDIIPAEDQVYDLGSNSNKFKDLYLSGSSIFLGDATITSVGNGIELPAESTINGQSILEGLGNGVVEGSNYKINIVADDSSIMVDSSTGTFTGDIKGSVISNDDTTLVDFTSKAVTASALTSPLINTSVIKTSDSSELTFNSPSRFTTRIAFDDLSQFFEEATFSTNVSLTRIVSLTQHHDNQFGSAISLRRSRGTQDSPTAVQVEDVLCDIDFNAFNGSSYVSSATIKGVADANPSGGYVPGRLDFITNDNLGVATRRMNIDSIGNVNVETTLRQTLDTYASGSLQAAFYQSYDNADVRNFGFLRSRGSIISPTSLNNNDDLVDIVFSGHDGTDYRSGAGITAIVTGTPSGGFMPTRLVFQTDDGISGGLQGRVLIRPSGNLWCLYGMAVRGDITPVDVDADLVLDPSSVGVGTVDLGVPEQSTVGAAGAASALPATPSTYFKIKVNGTEYVVPAYAVS